MNTARPGGPNGGKGSTAPRDPALGGFAATVEGLSRSSDRNISMVRQLTQGLTVYCKDKFVLKVLQCAIQMYDRLL